MSPNLITAPRRLILQSGLAAASVALVGQANAEDILDKAKQAVGLKTADVTPPEDLMREHGVLDRLLLIYEAAMQKFAAKVDFDPQVISDSAGVVQDFIENYHEKSEENFNISVDQGSSVAGQGHLMCGEGRGYCDMRR